MSEHFNLSSVDESLKQVFVHGLLYPSSPNLLDAEDTYHTETHHQISGITRNYMKWRDVARMNVGVPTVGLPTVDVQSTPCEINMIKKIQELILASSGQDVTMIKGFLEKDNLEQQIQGLIATCMLYFAFSCEFLMI
ncbi:unnamed protein product [Trichobilharzia regenti]|nr:unnamed protein product [Trichobilharzia regenti]